jgi:predicted TPR repeat methyltransferase
MVRDRHEGKLRDVYDAKSPEEIARHYDGWAKTYDAEMARAGYRHPSICLALFARYVAPKSRPILDAGAGTGLIGEWLGIIGYPDVEALDISQGMLSVAGKKNIYTRLHAAALGQPLDFDDDHFAAIISAGVFTTGHVGTEGLDELTRICRPGGFIVLTVKTTLWENGFAQTIAQLAKKGAMALVEQTDPYVSMPNDTSTVPSLAIVLRIEQ